MTKIKLCNQIKKLSANDNLTYFDVSEMIELLCLIEATERIRRGTLFNYNSKVFETLEKEVQKALKEIKRKK